MSELHAGLLGTAATSGLAANVLEGCVPSREMAKMRRITEATQRRERQLGIGPPFIRDGRRIYYRVEAVRRWLLEQEHHPRRRRG